MLRLRDHDVRFSPNHLMGHKIRVILWFMLREPLVSRRGKIP
jgi:hypothetical protein